MPLFSASLKEECLNILFPRRCPVCGDIILPKGNLICPGCMKKLSWVKGPVCKKCGKEVVNDTVEYCPDCVKRVRTFDSGRALIHYNEISSRSMAQIKYHNRREYLDFYAEAMYRRLGEAILRLKPEVIIPVPVHKSRLRSRGFNQAEELARRLCGRLDIPMDTSVLFRVKKTLPQKELNPAERLKNLEQAFLASGSAGKWKRVLLIDDIYTTGSTMEACARVLKKAGVKQVYFAVLFTGTGMK